MPRYLQSDVLVFGALLVVPTCVVLVLVLKAVFVCLFFHSRTLCSISSFVRLCNTKHNGTVCAQHGEMITYTEVIVEEARLQVLCRCV